MNETQGRPKKQTRLFHGWIHLIVRFLSIGYLSLQEYVGPPSCLCSFISPLQHPKLHHYIPSKCTYFVPVVLENNYICHEANYLQYLKENRCWLGQPSQKQDLPYHFGHEQTLSHGQQKRQINKYGDWMRIVPDMRSANPLKYAKR